MRFLIHVARCLGSIGLVFMLASCQPGTHAATSAQVYVTSAPTGALVVLDDVPGDQTPMTLMRIPPGEHLIILRKAGYREARTTITTRTGERIALEMTLEPLTGLVLIHSQPTGADVEINNADYGKTPLLLPHLPLGQYRLKASAIGYLSKIMDMTLADRTPQIINVTLVSDSAQVTIGSTPPGAMVVMDGAARGKTPCTIDAMSSGSHQISATLEGHTPYADEFTVQAGDAREINVTLIPLPGSLTIVSEPQKARVYLNDELKGESPLSITNIPVGEYIIRAEMRGYETQIKTNNVLFGEKSVAEFEMVKNSGILLISTEPPGVHIYLDGEDRGVTPPRGQEPISDQLQIDLVSQGNRKLQLTKQGYYDLAKTVDIEPNLTVILHEKLKLRPVPFIPTVIIRTGTGAEHTFKGIIRERYENGVIQLEIEPGIFKSFQPNEVLSVEPIETNK